MTEEMKEKVKPFGLPITCAGVGVNRVYGGMPEYCYTRRTCNGVFEENNSHARLLVHDLLRLC